MEDNDTGSNSQDYIMPASVSSLIDWCVPFELREVIKGDVSEGLFNRLTHTKLAAYVWLFKQVIAILWHFSPTTQRGSMMFIFSFLVVSSIIMMTFWLGSPPSMYFNLIQKTFQVIEKVAIMMGWFGVISGAIAIASNVEPEVFPRVFGPAFAVMSLTLLYALIVKVFCYLAILRLHGRARAF